MKARQGGGVSVTEGGRMSHCGCLSPRLYTTGRLTVATHWSARVGSFCGVSGVLIMRAVLPGPDRVAANLGCRPRGAGTISSFVPRRKIGMFSHARVQR